MPEHWLWESNIWQRSRSFDCISAQHETITSISSSISTSFGNPLSHPALTATPPFEEKVYILMTVGENSKQRNCTLN
eukprot:TRINITY_DN16497_c0_g1_i1.p1 TRINITY_DN16497_c0_g1~~TRINITY_DN16497_c0_g1_i1.p1  ORF type:complete len:77 (-),score=2.11 TRINITY_DN16497_c0_g1_i1:177-407(-)